jgi:hypothetical protein
MPVQEPRPAELPIAANFLCERTRNDWYAVGDQIISRDNFFGAV